MTDPPDTSHSLPPEPLTRAADLFERYADPARHALQRAWPGADGECTHDAVVNAILELADHPEKYNPQRGTVLNFLVSAARRYLGHIMRASGRRQHREQNYAQDSARPSQIGPPDILVANAELANRARGAVVSTPQEAAFLDLWCQGLDDTSQLAQALGLGDASPQNQAIAVKRTRDRLMQRLRRWGAASDDDSR